MHKNREKIIKKALDTQKTKNRRNTVKESKKAEKIRERPTKNTDSDIKNTENNGDVFVEGRHFVEHSSIDLFDLWSMSNNFFFRLLTK